MNLEHKLTEALDAAARTIPDTAQPPTVPSPTPRRRPVLIAALAAAAVIAAVAVPLAISRHDKGQVADGICPAAPAVTPLKIPQQNAQPDDEALNKIPFGPPPEIPFTMIPDDQNGKGYLEDLGVRVPLESGFRYSSIGRTACGWAVYRIGTSDEAKGEVGLLRPSGAFTSYGQLSGGGTSLSPDGTELVYVSPTNDHKGRIRVVNVATGKEIAAYLTDEKTAVLGWNPAGIWFAPGRDHARTSLWKPGSDPVLVDTGGHQLTAYRTTDRVLLTGLLGPGSDSCVRVAVLDGSRKLKTLREKCGGAGGTLSPDGKVLVFEGGTTRAVQVDTGAATRLNVSPSVLSADHVMIWEDATHLTNSFGVGGNRAVTIRCEVLSGRCERISDGAWQGQDWLPGPQLGSP